MNAEHLVRMANDIGRFFQAEPDRTRAVEGVRTHIKRFWDPRMRREIVAYVEKGGTGLLDLVREAVVRLDQR